MMAREKHEGPMQQADCERLVRTAQENKGKHPPILARAFARLAEHLMAWGSRQADVSSKVSAYISSKAPNLPRTKPAQKSDNYLSNEARDLRLYATPRVFLRHLADYLVFYNRERVHEGLDK